MRQDPARRTRLPFVNDARRMIRIAVLDDYQGVVLTLPCWRRLDGRAAIDLFRDTLADEAALAARLAPYEAIVAIRERTRFHASLLARLPALRHLAMTGRNTGHVDVGEATRRGVLGSLRQREAGLGQHAEHQLRVDLVLGAAEGGEVDLHVLR